MVSEAFVNVVTMLEAAMTVADGQPDPDLPTWREAYDSLGQMMPVADGNEFVAVDANGAAAEWATPTNAVDGRALLYLHGGGYAIGSLNSHRQMVSHLARAAGARVLNVDYRLAPEHPYPAAVDDALAAYRFLLDETDASRIAIAGDSAGGGLAVALLVAIRDAGLPMPAAAVSISPWTDLAQTGGSIEEIGAADPMVRKASLDHWSELYLVGRTPVDTPLASPLYADLTGLPPLLIQVGGREILLDDSKRLAERARAAGVDVTLEVAPEMFHVWHLFAGAVPEADEAVARAGEFIGKHAG